mgnify:CR=1 FL=1
MKDSHQNITTEIYNLSAQQYKKSSENFVFPGWMFEYFIHELSWQKILDVWCAFGRDVQKLRHLWYESYGIDISQNLINLSDNTIKKYLTLWDMSQLSDYYEHNSFSGVICSAVIVHIDKHVAEWVLQSVFHILKTSGVFFLTLKVNISFNCRKTIKIIDNLYNCHSTQ